MPSDVPVEIFNSIPKMQRKLKCIQIVLEAVIDACKHKLLLPTSMIKKHKNVWKSTLKKSIIAFISKFEQ